MQINFKDIYILLENFYRGETNEYFTQIYVQVAIEAEEGGRDHVIATTNWYSKIKKHGYNLNERHYEQSSDGRNGRVRFLTKWNLFGSLPWLAWR